MNLIAPITTLLWSIFFYSDFTSSATTINVSFFSDDSCRSQSVFTPSLDVALNTCVVTPGLASANYNRIACADGNQVILYGCQNVACTFDACYSYTSMGCLSGSFPFHAILFACGSLKGQALSSTTIVAITASDVISPVPNTATSRRDGVSTTASSPGQTSQSGSSGGTGSSDGADGAVSSGWLGLSNGERIGVIVSLAMGIPAIILAAVGVYYMRNRH